MDTRRVCLWSWLCVCVCVYLRFLIQYTSLKYDDDALSFVTIQTEHGGWAQRNGQGEWTTMLVGPGRTVDIEIDESLK